jgi:hypothetical protein
MYWQLGWYAKSMGLKINLLGLSNELNEVSMKVILISKRLENETCWEYVICVSTFWRSSINSIKDSIMWIIRNHDNSSILLYF